MKRSVVYDMISLVLLIVGIAGLFICGWYALQEQWKLACVSGVAGVLTVRLSHYFVRTAIAVSDRVRF